MNRFTYQYPVTVYFGEKTAVKNLPAELDKVGKNVMLAYGGGSIKKNGIYEELTNILKASGKNIIEFTGIMPNPTYAKVQEGAKIARENNIDFILAVGGGRFKSGANTSRVPSILTVWHFLLLHTDLLNFLLYIPHFLLLLVARPLEFL